MPMKKRLAVLISRIFDPFIEIPILLTASVLYAYFNGYEWQFLTLLLLIDAILPALFFYHLLKRHEIHDWDITQRKERYPLYGFTLAAHLVGIYFTYMSHQYHLGSMLIVFWFIGLIFFLITLFWKISLHGGVNMVLVTFVVLLFGRSFLWAYLILIPVGWSRIYLKKHTPVQFVSGSLIASGLFLVGFFLFGLI